MAATRPALASIPVANGTTQPHMESGVWPLYRATAPYSPHRLGFEIDVPLQKPAIPQRSILRAHRARDRHGTSVPPHITQPVDPNGESPMPDCLQARATIPRANALESRK